MMTEDTFAFFLGILGVFLVVVDLYDLAHKLEAFIDDSREKLRELLIDGINHFTDSHHDSVLAGILHLIAPVLAGSLLWIIPLTIVDILFGSNTIKFLLYGWAIVLPIALLFLVGWGIWAVASILDKFPKGTLGAVGFIAAIWSLVLDAPFPDSAQDYTPRTEPKRQAEEIL